MTTTSWRQGMDKTQNYFFEFEKVFKVEKVRW
jgi:hypothetical protein